MLEYRTVFFSYRVIRCFIQTKMTFHSDNTNLAPPYDFIADFFYFYLKYSAINEYYNTETVPLCKDFLCLCSTIHLVLLINLPIIYNTSITSTEVSLVKNFPLVYISFLLLMELFLHSILTFPAFKWSSKVPKLLRFYILIFLHHV